MILGEGHLKERLKEHFPKLPIIVVENKSDIKKIESARLKISAQEGHGVDELKNIILDELSKIEEN